MHHQSDTAHVHQNFREERSEEEPTFANDAQCDINQMVYFAIHCAFHLTAFPSYARIASMLTISLSSAQRRSLLLFRVCLCNAYTAAQVVPLYSVHMIYTYIVVVCAVQSTENLWME